MKAKSLILILGAGGHAMACIDVVEAEGRYRVLGLVGWKKETGRKVCGYSVVGTENDLPSLLKKTTHLVNGIGQIKSPQLRIKVFDKLVRMGVIFPAIKSPHAYVSKKAKLGEGTIVMHRATLQAGVQVGKNCIINDHALLEHGVSVGNHCHVSTGAILNGDVQIGEGSFIGSGSTIQEGVVIPPCSIVPMGTIVYRKKVN
jgi:sugar O-acyltransferase (sialic acid O-acetyltransferase NeuD family)